MWLILVVLTLTYVSVQGTSIRIDDILDVACEEGDLLGAYRMAVELSDSLGGTDSGLVASTLHIRSCLELVTSDWARVPGADPLVVTPSSSLERPSS